MPDDRKPVTCPWCGREMKIDPYHDDQEQYDSYDLWYVCECGATSPSGYGETNIKAEKAAYAATRGPENKPLASLSTTELCDGMNKALSTLIDVSNELSKRTGLPVGVEIETLKRKQTSSEAHEDAYAAATQRPLVDGNTSDGYHTFKELYHHRAVLFAALIAQMPDKAWKSKQHSDGTMYDGMFIVGIETPDGQATYHYDTDPYWGMFCCRELDYAPEWDGHTPAQAIGRIERMTAVPPNKPLTLPELFDLEPESDAVWVVTDAFAAYDVRVMSAESACEWASDAETVLFFARKPTPADIESAIAERKKNGTD